MMHTLELPELQVLEALEYAKIISIAKISEIFEQAGFTSIKWLMEDVSNYYQPIILATK